MNIKTRVIGHLCVCLELPATGESPQKGLPCHAVITIQLLIFKLLFKLFINNINSFVWSLITYYHKATEIMS